MSCGTHGAGVIWSLRLWLQERASCKEPGGYDCGQHSCSLLRRTKHSLGHLSSFSLLSLGLLGRSQALCLSQVVHSNGQEDIEQDI
jgi:hypothetical protein